MPTSTALAPPSFVGLGATAILLTTAGCLVDRATIEWWTEPPWSAAPCDPAHAPSIAGDLRPAGAFAQSLDRFAQRLGDAVNDPRAPSRDRAYKTGDLENGPLFHEWATKHGRIVYDHRASVATQRLLYEEERVWPTHRNETGLAELRTMYERLGVLPGQNLTFEFAVRTSAGGSQGTAYGTQWFAGKSVGFRILDGTTASGHLPIGDPNSPFFGRFTLQRVYDLSGARIDVLADRAAQIAVDVTACMTGGAPDSFKASSTSRLAVEHDSLVHVISVDPAGGCGTLYEVTVDARTAAVHTYRASGSAICDYVT